MAKTAPGRQLTGRGAPSARLVVREPGRGVRCVRLAGTRMAVGRGEGNDITLADTRASGKHALIQRPSGRGAWTLTDLGSNNGSFLNGRPVACEELADNDVIRWGDTLAIVELGFADDASFADPTRALATSLLALDVVEATESNLPILLTGPTGAGKGHLARHIADSSRPGRAFVQVNCAALPQDLVESELFGHVRGAFTGSHGDKDGLITSAQGGTLLLDEIGAVGPDIQAKLLTCIESATVRPVGSTRSRPVDVRFIAATGRDLPQAIREGTFRRDLYYRLSGIEIAVAGLARRRVDVMALLASDEALGDLSRLSPEALEALLNHDWPGNVRELLALAARLARREQGIIDYHALPSRMRDFLLDRGADEHETGRSSAPAKQVLVDGLAQCEGNVAALARRLGKHRNQVVRWLDHHGIDRGRASE